MLLFLRNFHLAGEWVVGGVEAKGLPMCSCFWRWRRLSANRWRAALLLAGAAGAFHVLVGGWTAVAIGLAWLLAGNERPAAAVADSRRRRRLRARAAGADSGARPELGRAERDRPRSGADLRLRPAVASPGLSSLSAVHQLAFRVAARRLWLPLAWSLRREAGAAAAAACRRRRGGRSRWSASLIDQAWCCESNSPANRRTSIELRRRGAAALLLVPHERLARAGRRSAGASSLAWRGCRRRGRRWRNWLTDRRPSCWPRRIWPTSCYWRSQQPLPGADLQPRPTADSRPRWWFSRVRSAKPSGAVTADEWFRDWQSGLPLDRRQHAARCRLPHAARAADVQVVCRPGRGGELEGRAAGCPRADRVEAATRPSSIPRSRLHHRHDLAAFTDAELIALARKYRRQITSSSTARGRSAPIRPAAGLSAVRARTTRRLTSIACRNARSP